MRKAHLKGNLAYEVKDDLTSLILDESQPTKKVKVEPFVTKEIPSILKKYIDVFVWCQTDMSCVSPWLLTNKLNIPPNIKSV